MSTNRGLEGTSVTFTDAQGVAHTAHVTADHGPTGPHDQKPLDLSYTDNAGHAATETSVPHQSRASAPGGRCWS